MRHLLFSHRLRLKIGRSLVEARRGNAWRKRNLLRRWRKVWRSWIPLLKAIRYYCRLSVNGICLFRFIRLVPQSGIFCLSWICRRHQRWTYWKTRLKPYWLWVVLLWLIGCIIALISLKCAIPRRGIFSILLLSIIIWLVHTHPDLSSRLLIRVINLKSGLISLLLKQRSWFPVRDLSESLSIMRVYLNLCLFI